MGLLNNIVQFIEESETSWDDIARALEINNLDIEKIAKKVKPEKEFVNTITRTIWCKLLESVNLKYDYYNHILKLSTTNSLGKNLIDQHSNQQGTINVQDPTVLVDQVNEPTKPNNINKQEQNNATHNLDVSMISLKTEHTEQQEKDIPSYQSETVGPSSSGFETDQDGNQSRKVELISDEQKIGDTAGVPKEFEVVEDSNSTLDRKLTKKEMYQRLDEIIERGDDDELKRFCLVNKIDFKNNIHILNESLYRYVNILKLLIHNGADVNVKTEKGYTPLHIASDKGYVNITQLMIDNDADVNVKNTIGLTPLHIASNKGYVNIAQLLINDCADVNVTNTFGVTPLHSASYNGYVNIGELLINNGADVNAKDTYGKTPLHRASDIGYENFAELLINNGADVNLKDGIHQTPLDWAKLCKHKSIITLLESKKK